MALANFVNTAQVQERAKHPPLVAGNLGDLGGCCKRFPRDVRDRELALLVGTEDVIDSPGAEDETL